MKNMRAYYYIATTSAILLLSFQNCSPVKFGGVTQLSSLSAMSTNGIVINRDAPYTNNTQAMLQINVDGAIDMYVTNTPDCSGGGAWQPISREIPWGLSEKNKSTSVYAKFRANLNSETPCIHDSIIHDDVPPVLSLKQAPLAKTNTVSTNIKLAVLELGSGLDKVVCPPEISPCTEDLTVNNSSEGLKNFDFYALDRAGNKSLILNTSWLVDKTPPQIMFTSTPATKTNMPTANFVVAANDNYSATAAIKFKCLIDAGAYQDCMSTISFTNLADGLHSVKAYASDEVGNVSDPITYSWTIGRKIPSIKYTETPKPNTNLKGQFAFEGADQFGAPLVSYQCSLNGSAFAPCNSPYPLTVVNEGANKFKIKGTDSLGLESGELEYQWMYDTIIPIVSWVTFPAEFSKNANEPIKISVTGDLQPLESIEFLLDAKSLVKSLADASNLIGLTEGFHTISVIVTDKAGNKNVASSKTFWSDFTAPTLNYPAVATPTKNTNLSLPVTAGDNNISANNIISLFYILDESPTNTAYSPFAAPLVINNLKHGLHLIKMYAVDKAGNKSSIYLTNEFLVDLYAPAITFVQQPSADITAGTQVTVEYLVQDTDTGLQSVNCKFSNSKSIISAGTCADKATLLLPIYSSDTYVFEISAVDKVGNTSLKSITWKTGLLYEQKTQVFNVTSLTNSKVDILLVIDNSGSMSGEQTKISEAFSNFLANLGTLDYRIAITTTDTAASTAKGSIRTFAGTNLTYIEPTTTNGLSLLQTNVKVGIYGSGIEKGLTAIDMFVDKARTASTNEYKFLRPEAVFSSIVITDSDEAANAGFQTADSFLTQFKTKLPNKTYIHHSSIVLPNDSACKANGEVYGITYFDLSKATGGISASVCSTDYVNQFKNFAATIVNKISEQTLACSPIDINNDGKVDIDISYLSSGGATGKITEFTLTDKKVSFTAPLVVVGDYTILYNCLK